MKGKKHEITLSDNYKALVADLKGDKINFNLFKNCKSVVFN